MKSFARATKLTNITGRADYISNPDRQEKILAKSASIDLEPYQQFERAKQKTLAAGSKNIEGREIILALPNEWSKLRQKELARRADHLARTIVGDDRDVQWAVHWNKAHTNLHLHVIFSERQREKEPGRWDRDIYLTAEGKVARTKADRARLPDGSIAPPVHRKGELKDGFTAKDPRFKQKGWLHDLKGQLKKEMQDRWKVKFEERGLLSEYHEGKGREAPAIRKKNEAIRVINKNYIEMLAHPEMTQKNKRDFEKAAPRTAREGSVIYFVPENGLIGACDLEHWKAKEASQSASKRHKKRSETPQKAPEGRKGLFERAKDAREAKAAENAALRAQEAARDEAQSRAIRKSLDEWMEPVERRYDRKPVEQPVKQPTSKPANQKSMEEHQAEIRAAREQAATQSKGKERQREKPKEKGYGDR